MGDFISEQTMDEKRIEKFMNQVRDICRSQQTFRTRMDVNVSHIAWRAAQAQQNVRNAITSEHMAGLIIHGQLCRENCKVVKPLEIVFDGRFAELNETLFSPVRSVTYTNVGMRIVVREGSSKHIVLTVYPLTDLQDDALMSLPEVPNEIW